MNKKSVLYDEDAAPIGTESWCDSFRYIRPSTARHNLIKEKAR
jgi:hypothetical protein